MLGQLKQKIALFLQQQAALGSQTERVSAGFRELSASVTAMGSAVADIKARIEGAILPEQYVHSSYAIEAEDLLIDRLLAAVVGQGPELM